MYCPLLIDTGAQARPAFIDLRDTAGGSNPCCLWCATDDVCHTGLSPGSLGKQRFQSPSLRVCTWLGMSLGRRLVMFGPMGGGGA